MQEERNVGEGREGGAERPPEQPPIFRETKRFYYVVLAIALAVVAVWFFVIRPSRAAKKRPGARSAQEQMIEAGGAQSTVTALFRTTEGRVLSGTTDGRLTLWGGDRLDEPLWSVQAGGVSSVAAAGPVVALGGMEGDVRLLDAGTGKAVRDLGRFEDGPALSLDLSPDGRLVAGGGMDGTGFVWEAETGRQVSKFSTTGGIMLARFVNPQTVLTITYPGVIERWQALTGEPAGDPLELDVTAVAAADLSPSKQKLAVGSTDGQALLIDLAANRALKRITDLSGSVWALAFSQDERLALCDERKVGVFDVKTGDSKSAPLGAGRRCTSLSFAESGGGLLVGLEGGKVYRADL